MAGRAKMLVLLLLFVCLFTRAQSLDEFATRIEKFGKTVPQEEVFVHMDNTCYFLGDTIFYKAYLRRSDNGLPSGLSGLLYVELLNQDGYLVERQKVKMEYGQGAGSIALPDTIYGGFYELRAYTRWQLNWGEYEHAHSAFVEKWFLNKEMSKQYFRDYDKIYSRVFPVYDKPQKQGEYYQDMTTRPLQRYFKADNSEPEAEVTFFPEGGSLVEGTTCRVAFEANNEEGKHLKGTLTVTDSNGNTVATASTESRGRGTFDLPCKSGEKYKATFNWDNHSKKVNLPKIVADGVRLKADLTDQSLHLDIQAAGVATQQQLGLTIMEHGVQQEYQKLTSTTAQLDIPLTKLPTGIAQITIFNSEGRVYADRMVFVRQPDFQAQNIALDGINENGYQAFAPIEIQLQGKPSGILSVAVRDAAHTDYTFDSGNILTEMLLASQIKGFVEQPEYFFESDDQEHRRALDLLLMVQGWRRYDWVTMATPKAFTLTHPYEKTQILNGQLYKYTADDVEDYYYVQTGDNHKDLFRNVDKGGIVSGGSSGPLLEEVLRLRQPADSTEVYIIGSTKDPKFYYSGQFQKFSNARISGFESIYFVSSHNDHTFLQSATPISQEMQLHAEFVLPYSDAKPDIAIGDMQTSNGGKFRIEVPGFGNHVYFFLSASDTTKWKSQDHAWVQSSENKRDELEVPEFYIKLNHIYPRFPKPYTYYQNNNFNLQRSDKHKRYTVDDAKVRTLDQVTIGARHNGRRGFSSAKPAFVVDAYEAFNEVCDAGFCPGVYTGFQSFALNLARNYIGEMGIARSYELERRWNGKNETFFKSPSQQYEYCHLPNLDKVYIYTDYSPRLEGSHRFEGGNQPPVTVDLHVFEDNSKRMTYRDRRYVLSGYSECADFYHPNYSKRPLPTVKDYRRTLYWNPYLQLDKEGKASIQFYNNSKQTQIVVDAQGMTLKGDLLNGYYE